MIGYYVAYPPAAEEWAEKVNEAFAAAGLCNTQDAAHSGKEALRLADFLLLVVTERAQAELPDMRNAWEFFENEIRWRRKPHGEILFIAPDESVLVNLPLRLKKYGYYLMTEAGDAAAYCKDAYQTAQESAAREKKETPPVKEIKYSPAAESVPQIKFSVRAPAIKSFDK